MVGLPKVVNPPAIFCVETSKHATEHKISSVYYTLEIMIMEMITYMVILW